MKALKGKGRGKDGYGGGKGGAGPWGGKAKGDGKGKGKGKGYQGVCLDCGLKGHKRGEAMCPVVSGARRDVNLVEWWPKTEEEGTESVEKSANVVEFGGGACQTWDLCAVEVDPGGFEGAGATDGGAGVVRGKATGAETRRQTARRRRTSRQQRRRRRGEAGGGRSKTPRRL